MNLRGKLILVVAVMFSIFILLVYTSLSCLFNLQLNNFEENNFIYSVCFILLMVVVYAIILYHILDRVILRRLFVLITSVNKIAQTQDLSAFFVPGKDEIADLAQTINKILVALSTEKILRQQALNELQELNRSLEQRVLEKTTQLQKQLYTDHLTATPNRLQLIEDIREATQPCLAIINIDKFRTINEFYGHQAGDGLLQELAYRLKKLLEPYHYQLYHLDGDEYAILTDGEKDNNFSSWMLGIHDAIENIPFKIHGHSYYLFVTVGIAITGDKPLEKVQMALEYARQCCLPLQVYHDDLPTREVYRNNLYWIQEVQDAIQENRIMVYYQPIMDAVTAKISKYEALVRLRNRDGQVVSPSVFLPIIKKTKLYPRLTEVVIEKSFTYLADKDIDFSINLSAADILDNGVQDLIMKLLAKSHIADRVTFEFVESEEFKDPNSLTIFINKIKHYGAKIAIDDFGSGYSNFAYILNMGANYIKIDGSLISEIGTNSSVDAIVESIVHFAQQLGVKTIAEYVSSKSIYITAKRIGVDYVQGYYIGKPQAHLVGESS